MEIVRRQDNHMVKTSREALWNVRRLPLELCIDWDFHCYFFAKPNEWNIYCTQSTKDRGFDDRMIASLLTHSLYKILKVLVLCAALALRFDCHYFRAFFLWFFVCRLFGCLCSFECFFWLLFELAFWLLASSSVSLCGGSFGASTSTLPPPKSRLRISGSSGHPFRYHPDTDFGMIRTKNPSLVFGVLA